jgi:hypothetical protein
MVKLEWPTKLFWRHKTWLKDLKARCNYSKYSLRTSLESSKCLNL